MWNTIRPRIKPPTFSFIKKPFFRLLAAFDRAQLQERLIEGGDSVLVALSGGADSVSLLYLLNRVRRKRDLKIFAAHLDHGYHDQSSRQRDFCQKLCLKLSIPFYSKKISLRRCAKKHGRSLEEAGRIERYRFFTDVCLKTGSKKIATAHTLDDQAETVLMRLFRGAGLRGISGMPMRRADHDLQIVRPLLHCHKKDILSWLRSEKIDFVEDPTNQSDRFTRNYIRRNILPRIEKRVNPQVREALIDCQSASREALDWLQLCAARSFRRVVAQKKEGILIRARSASKLHPAVLDEVIRMAAADIRGDYLALGFHHIRSMRMALLSKCAEERVIHLPGKMLVRCSKDGLWLKRRSASLT